MKTAWLATLGALCFAPLVWAQEQEGSGSETEGRDVAPGPTPKGASSGKETAPGEVHTVVKGDTLWDLSQHYLGSPWYWPKVWSYNPEIANPHWIYPGNQVRFFPSGEEVPSRVEVGEAPNDAPAETAEAPADEGDEVSASSLLEQEPTKVQGTAVLGYQPPKGLRLSHQSFVTQKEVEEAGVIAHSFAESTMLSFPDSVYVKMRKKGSLKVGDRMVIFRPGQEIVHPVTGSKVGYQTFLIGSLKITRISEQYATGQIQPDCWDEVLRGDLLGPYSDKMVEIVPPRANEREMRGYIVGSEIPALALLGEHHIIVIDRGSTDGVQPGNSFTVVRRQDPTASVRSFVHPSDSIDTTLPEEDVGSCMAVDVKEKATLCMVTRSIRDLERGDRVEMRTQASTASR